MLLVPVRPIPGSIMRGGGWYEDFAKTGARTSGLIGGLQTAVVPSEWGIKLEPSIDSVSIGMPVRFVQSYTDFEAEWVWRGYGTPSASTEIGVSFRYYDNANRFYVSRTGSGNSLKVVRVLGNVYTTLATVTGIPFSSWVRTGLRVVGPNIEVFNNGRRIISLTDAAHMRFGGIRYIYNYDPTPGVARGEWQYIAIRPLGFNPFVVQDSFNRADGAIGTADSGHVWQGSGLTISSNQAASDGVATYSQDVAALIADCEVAATWTLSGTLSNGTGMRLRAAAAVSGDRIALHWETSGGNVTALTLYRVVTGVFTSIGAWSISSPLPSPTYSLRVSMIGSAILVYVDDVLRISATEATYATNTNHGVRTALGDTSARIENFSVKRVG